MMKNQVRPVTDQQSLQFGGKQALAFYGKWQVPVELEMFLPQWSSQKCVFAKVYVRDAIHVWSCQKMIAKETQTFHLHAPIAY